MAAQDGAPVRRTTTDLTFTIIFGVLQLTASFALSALGWFQLMSVASCSERACDYGTLGVAGCLTVIVSVVTLVGCLALVLVRALRRQSMWWVTGSGFAAVVLAYIIATTLNQVARG